MNAQTEASTSDNPDNSSPDTETLMPPAYGHVVGVKGHIYYLKVFYDFQQNGQLFRPVWNLPAFLFAGLWAFYRKMYVSALLWAIVVYVALQLGLKTDPVAMTLILTMALAFGLFGNALYYHKVGRTIARFSTTDTEDRDKAIANLTFAGGVHSWLPWLLISILVLSSATSIVANFISGEGRSGVSLIQMLMRAE